MVYHRFRSGLVLCAALLSLGAAQTALARPSPLTTPPLYAPPTFDPGPPPRASIDPAAPLLALASRPAQPVRRAGRTTAALSRRFTP